MAKQINIFVDNKPGKLKAIAGLLFKNEINIRAVTIHDRKEFGMIKLLVDKPEKAHLILQDNGFASAIKEVLAIFISDKPGGLFNLASSFEKHEINIIDAYSFTKESKNVAIWCSEVSDFKKAENLLKADGYTILSDEDLAEL
jgi:hypothetical protein